MKESALLIDGNNHAWRTWKIACRDVGTNFRESLAPYREALSIFEPDEWKPENIDFMGAVNTMLKMGRKVVTRHFRYMFLKDLYFFITKHRPTEIVIAIDDRGKNWRHRVFKDYKGKRTYEPDLMFPKGPILEVCDPPTGMTLDNSGECNHLKPQDMYEIYREMVIEISKNFPSVKIMVCKDIEGDDIIATYVKHFSSLHECVIVSNDKDFPQLLSRPNVKIWNQHKRSFVKEADPETYLLVKILVGDKSDNIPNVKYGIGEATAMKYINCVSGAKGKYLDGLDGLWKNHPEAYDQFLLNKSLIDMGQIPSEIEESIMSRYSELDMRKIGSQINSRGWLSYIQSHNLRGLVNQQHTFLQMMRNVK